MQQYFSKKREGNNLILDDNDFHHIKNVMRIKPNDEILVGYDNIIYLCFLNNDYKSATIKNIFKEGTEKVKVTAYIPVLSDDKMSFIIEKGTEMGVSKFIPVQFSHSKFVMQLDKQEKKLERWRRIAKEASEQSRRLLIPEVTSIIVVDNIVTETGVNILCSLDRENVKSIREVLNDKTMCDKISLVFGPEGGISKEEENILSSKGFVKTSLGNNILRTEIVIVNVCSIINYLNG